MKTVSTWLAFFYTDFLSTQSSLNIGKFSNAYDSLYQALYYEGPYEQVLDDYRDSVNAIYARIGILDDALWNNRDSSALADLINDEYENIFKYECNFRQKDSLINLILDERIENAITYTEAISPDSIWQTALRFTLLEFLKYAKNDTLASVGALEVLADNCPEKYGNPVFFARSLLRAEQDKMVYDNDDLCNFVTPRAILTEEIPSCKVIPNPATSMIEIHSTSEISGMEMFTMDGRIVSPQITHYGNLVKADVSNLPNGIYVCRVLFKNKQVQTVRISVIH